MGFAGRRRPRSDLGCIRDKRLGAVNLEAGSHAQYVHAGRSLAHYLDVLAIHLTLLGVISPDAEIVLRGPKTTILSYGLWRNAVGASLKILEQVALLKRESYAVIVGGIHTQGFHPR
jgi:hypothetical protein